MAIAPGTGLAGLQRLATEVGRIRIGISEPTGRLDRHGKEIRKGRKLDTFRFTSQSRMLINQVADLYGGTPERWLPQNGGAAQWQVFVEQQSIPVVVPPNPITQFYEQWAGGRCVVRCTGERELIEERPCVCDPDPRERKCKPTTRLSLMLAEAPGIGLWRLESHGYYSAVELPAVAELLALAGGHIGAVLELQQRSVVRPDPRKPGETVTVAFAVPVLHAGVTPAQLLSGQGAIRPDQLTAPGIPAAVTGADVREAIEAADPSPPALAATAVPSPPAGFTHLQDLLEQIRDADGRAEMQLIKDQIARRLPPGADRDTASTAWTERAHAIVKATSHPGTAQTTPTDKPSLPSPVQPDIPPRPGPAQSDRSSQPVPAQPDKPSLPGPSRPDGPSQTPAPDRTAAWQAVLAAAGEVGLDLAEVDRQLSVHTGGTYDRYDAPAGVLAEFETALRAGTYPR